MGFNAEMPYYDLPLLPPRVELETVRTLKRAIGANKALAELKGVGGLIPNQSILLRSILLQEAKLSSEVENIFTTDDKLYKAFSENNKQVDPHTKEVLRYEEALWHGYRQLRQRPLTTSLFVEIVNIIVQNESGIRKMPGTRIVNSITNETIYTPPDGEERLRNLLCNLEEFVYAEGDLDPLIRLAVMHYQFEAIHPFGDGNGRTGRIINILYLISQGLLEIPVLYLSRYIIERKSAYYRGLKAVTEKNDWEDCVVFMLEGIEQTAIATKDKIVAIRKLLDESLETARQVVPRIYSKELIELIFEQPYCRIEFLERKGIAKRQTASRYLKELARVGMLQQMPFGREVLYINLPLFQLLTK